MTEPHHPFGPSKLGRIYSCPASWGLSKDEPEIKSEWAEEGTLLHKHTALLISKKVWESAALRELTDEQRDLCERCYDFLDETVEEGLLFVEQRASLHDAAGEINNGTADVIACDGRKIVIIDWKFGRKINETALSLQISAYAAAAVQSMPELKDLRHLPIEAWAYFPRSGEKLVWRAGSGNGASQVVAPLVRETRQKAEDSDGTGAIPGTHCDYCPHLPNCSAVRSAAGELEPAMTTDISNPQRALQLYDLSLVVEKQAAAVRARIREQLLAAPDSIPGLVLKNRAGKRAATSEIRGRLVAGSVGLSIIEYMKALEPNIVALENAYLDKHYDGRGKGKLTKVEIKKAFAALCGDAIKRTSSKVLTRVEGEA